MTQNLTEALPADPTAQQDNLDLSRPIPQPFPRAPQHDEPDAVQSGGCASDTQNAQDSGAASPQAAAGSEGLRESALLVDSQVASVDNTTTMCSGSNVDPSFPHMGEWNRLETGMDMEMRAFGAFRTVIRADAHRRTLTNRSR